MMTMRQARVSPKRNGSGRMGCRDGGPPETATEAQLSRVKDALDALEAAGLTDPRQALWRSLPYALRMEYNWSRWTYVPPKAEKVAA